MADCQVSLGFLEGISVQNPVAYLIALSYEYLNGAFRAKRSAGIWL